ncbi:hypothetical protein HY745_09770 [Candidatus Desantisbacteria bacterium]|nr:hypothetical protein [Candidatus Desantisbacteria bacterium]
MYLIKKIYKEKYIKKNTGLFLIYFITILLQYFFSVQVKAEFKKGQLQVATRKVQLLTQLRAEQCGAPRAFDNPRGIYDDNDNEVLYVIAKPSGPVYKFDLRNDYKFLEEIGTGTAFSNDLMDIRVSENGDIYVVDARKNQIFIFNAEGNLKQIINAKDNRKKKEKELGIVSIDFNNKGDIFLSDRGGQGVQVLDAEGNYLYQIVKVSSGKEEFGFPSISQLKLNSNDDIYVLDNLMYKVIKFTPKGKTLLIFGGRGDAAGKFIDATGMNIDNKDRIYIVEQLTGTIQVFDRDGNFLHVLVNENEGRLVLDSPSRIALDKTGRIYVMEPMRDRLTVLKSID